MRNDFFLSPGAEQITPVHLAQLSVNALMQACRDARFRRLTHWRGLAQSGGPQGSFTSRMDTFPGVFGFAPGNIETLADGLRMSCALHYFPSPDEARCETLRLPAAVLTGTPEYAENIRHFSLYPLLTGWTGQAEAVRHSMLTGPFQIANLVLNVNNSGSRIVLALSGPVQRRRIAPSGILYPQQPGQDKAWLVAPDELEEDVPALPLAREWLMVLASAVTTSSGEAPAMFRRSSRSVDLECTDGIRTLGMRPDPSNSWETDCYVWGQTEDFVKKFGDAGPWIAGLDCPTDTAGATGMDAIFSSENLPEDIRNSPCWTSHRLDKSIHNGLQGLDLRPGMLVLSGFLGAGKTTVLNQLIEWQRGRERCVGVIQNEIGATGVDARLLGDAASVVAMDEGCVCCTLAGNLSTGIRSLQAEANPECIILETTGLANPLNLLAEMDEIREIVRLDAVVTVVDARHGAAVLAESDVARDQVRAADMIILNKCDLASPAELKVVRSCLRKLGATIVHETVHGALPSGLLAHLERKTSPPGLLPHPVHHADHMEEGYDSVRMFLPHPVEPKILRRLVSECPGSPFRIKGIVRTGINTEPQALQYVGGEYLLEDIDMSEPGMFSEHVHESETHGPEDDSPKLGAEFVVCIGRHLNREAIIQHWRTAGAVEEPGHEHH